MIVVVRSVPSTGRLHGCLITATRAYLGYETDEVSSPPHPSTSSDLTIMFAKHYIIVMPRIPYNLNPYVRLHDTDVVVGVVQASLQALLRRLRTTPTLR